MVTEDTQNAEAEFQRVVGHADVVTVDRTRSCWSNHDDRTPPGRIRRGNAPSSMSCGSCSASGLKQRRKEAKMKFRTLVGAAMMVAVAVGLVGAGIAGAAEATSGTDYTCTGGVIPSGNYSSLTVTGACQTAQAAVINVSGSINGRSSVSGLTPKASRRRSLSDRTSPRAQVRFLALGCQPRTFSIGHFAGVPGAVAMTRRRALSPSTGT